MASNAGDTLTEKDLTDMDSPKTTIVEVGGEKELSESGFAIHIAYLGFMINNFPKHFKA
jgi:hypothetical protein